MEKNLIRTITITKNHVTFNRGLIEKTYRYITNSTQNRILQLTQKISMLFGNEKMIVIDLWLSGYYPPKN